MEVVIPIGKLNPSWDLGVDMRIHIVQDFNDAVEVFLGEGRMLVCSAVVQLVRALVFPPRYARATQQFRSVHIREFQV